MSKYLKTWFMREQEQLLNEEKISYSKWLENIEEEVIKNYKLLNQNKDGEQGKLLEKK